LEFVSYELQKQYPELPLEAVRNNGIALRFVETKTMKLWEEAVKSNGEIIEYLPYRPELKELFLQAFRSKGKALRHLETAQRTRVFCLEAVKSDGEALEFVPNNKKTFDICLAAYINNRLAIIHSPFTKEALLEILSKEQMKNLLCLSRVPKLGYHGIVHKSRFMEKIFSYLDLNTEIIQHNKDKRVKHEIFLRTMMEDVKSTGNALRFIPDKLKIKYPGLCLEAVKNDGTSLQFVPYELMIKYQELSLEAVKRTGNALRFIPDKLKIKYPLVCLEAVKNDGTSLQFLPYELKTRELSLEAVKNTSKAFKFVPDGLKSEMTEQLRITEAQEYERAEIEHSDAAAAKDAGKGAMNLPRLRDRRGGKTRKKRKTRRR